MKKLILAFAMIATLGGCASGMVGYGNPNHVLFESDDHIKIMWDVLLDSEEDVQAIAQTHCNERKATLTDVDIDSASGGLVRTYTYTCK